MDIVGRLRGAAPFLGLLTGTAALGAGIAYGSARVAGNSDGGRSMELLGNLGPMPIVAGGLSGLTAWQVGGRVAGGSMIPGILGILIMPAGLAGAALGAKLGRSELRSTHAEEYAAQDRLIDSTMEATHTALHDAGAAESMLTRAPISYDRSYFGVSYFPPKGPLGDKIVVGRHLETGTPYATDDLIAHEFAHKVLHAYAPDLGSGSETSGDGSAIHESIADTIAMLVDREDWLIGEDTLPGGLRSFSHPERRGLVDGDEVVPAPITRAQLADADPEEHLRAGVGNKAAWRIGDALGRDAMARIYVAALERRELGSGATYADLARVVRAAAVELYGADSHEAAVVDSSWTTAGY